MVVVVVAAAAAVAAVRYRSMCAWRFVPLWGKRGEIEKKRAERSTKRRETSGERPYTIDRSLADKESQQHLETGTQAKRRKTHRTKSITGDGIRRTSFASRKKRQQKTAGIFHSSIRQVYLKREDFGTKYLSIANYLNPCRGYICLQMTSSESPRL